MKTVLALYDDPETAQRAFDALERCGLPAKAITVVSSEPFQMFAFGRDERGTWMPWLAALGGVVGGSLGFWLTTTAQTLWPLQTGGMPIVTMWTNAIIIYELTMLGAILATLGTFLASAILPGGRRRLYDPVVSEGKILICVTNPHANSSEDLARRLREIGGGEPKETDLQTVSPSVETPSLTVFSAPEVGRQSAHGERAPPDSHASGPPSRQAH